MDIDNHEAELRQRLLTLTMIWFSMTVSVAVYAPALYLLDMNGVLPFGLANDENESTIRMAFLLMAATAGGTTFTLPGILLKPEAIREQLQKKGIDPRSLSANGLALELFPQYQVVGIIRWGAAEAVGLMGLILGLLYGIDPLVYILLFIMAAALAATKPSREGLDRLATAVRGY